MLIEKPFKQIGYFISMLWDQLMDFLIFALRYMFSSVYNLNELTVCLNVVHHISAVVAGSGLG